MTTNNQDECPSCGQIDWKFDRHYITPNLTSITNKPFTLHEVFQCNHCRNYLTLLSEVTLKHARTLKDLSNPE